MMFYGLEADDIVMKILEQGCFFSLHMHNVYN